MKKKRTAVMTAVTNNRRRPWPRLPMTADAHDRGHPKKKKKIKNKIKKKNKKKKKNGGHDGGHQ